MLWRGMQDVEQPVSTIIASGCSLPLEMETPCRMIISL